MEKSITSQIYQTKRGPKEGNRVFTTLAHAQAYINDLLNRDGTIHTDGDGKIDVETLTNTFAGYAPSDNPVASFVVVSPDIGHYHGKSMYHTFVNKKISYEVSKKFFEIYK